MKLFYLSALFFILLMGASNAFGAQETLLIEKVNGRDMIDGYMYGPQSDRGIVSLGLTWKPGDDIKQIEGYRFSLAQSARLLSPRTRNCNITHIAGMMYSSDSPVPFGTLALQIQGRGCRNFIARMKNARFFSFQFNQIPRTRNGVEPSLRLLINR